MNLTFLAHDDEGNMRLIKRTTDSDTPDVEQEWEFAVQVWREKVPLLGDLTLVGALRVTEDNRIRWYPDVEDALSPGVVSRTLH